MERVMQKATARSDSSFDGRDLIGFGTVVLIVEEWLNPESKPFFLLGFTGALRSLTGWTLPRYFNSDLS
jgi:hypothetical protein